MYCVKTYIMDREERKSICCGSYKYLTKRKAKKVKNELENEWYSHAVGVGECFLRFEDVNHLGVNMTIPVYPLNEWDDKLYAREQQKGMFAIVVKC